MNRETALRLSTENLAKKLVWRLPVCDQPRRDQLDWLIAEKFLDQEHPGLIFAGSHWFSLPDDFSSADFEKMHGREIWEFAVPAYVEFIEKGNSCSKFTPFTSGEFVIKMAIRYFCIVKLARLLYEHLISPLTGDNRAELDWRTAQDVIDHGSHAVSIIQGHTSLAALYSYERFNHGHGIIVWREAYLPAIVNRLPLGYTHLRTCPDCATGCNHPNAVLVT
ncbi:MAG: hypothetical protein WC477_06510 [Patescibacteria group bacterium]